MSTRDGVLQGRDDGQSGDAAIIRTYGNLPGMNGDMLSPAVINATKAMSCDAGGEGVEDECNGLLSYLDLLADLDWGRVFLFGNHPTSGDRLSIKIPSAIDITKKIKSVEWIRDRPKQEIDATREITNGGTESAVADLLQERSSCQADGIGFKDGESQEEHSQLVKGLEMIATVRLSKGNEGARSPAQGKVEIDQASIGVKQSVCEDSTTKDGDHDDSDTVHKESRRQSGGMSTRDGVLQGRDDGQSGDAAIIRTYGNLPGMNGDMLSPAVINATKAMSCDAGGEGVEDECNGLLS
ncbi:hypothetical protein ABG067_008193, partial [Albugo candida]